MASRLPIRAPSGFVLSSTIPDRRTDAAYAVFLDALSDSCEIQIRRIFAHSADARKGLGISSSEDANGLGVTKNYFGGYDCQIITLPHSTLLERSQSRKIKSACLLREVTPMAKDGTNVPPYSFSKPQRKASQKRKASKKKQRPSIESLAPIDILGFFYDDLARRLDQLASKRRGKSVDYYKFSTMKERAGLESDDSFAVLARKALKLASYETRKGAWFDVPGMRKDKPKTGINVGLKLSQGAAEEIASGLQTRWDEVDHDVRSLIRRWKLLGERDYGQLKKTDMVSLRVARANLSRQTVSLSR